MKNTVTEWLPNILIMSCCILIATSSTALASGGSWEWESNMDSIVQSFSGPMARLISVLAIIGLAALLMVNEFGSTLRRIIQIVIGLTILLTASTVVSKFGGGSGCLLP